MSGKNRSKDRPFSSPTSAKNSAAMKKLYPNLENMSFDEDDDDDSWLNSGGENATMSTTRTTTDYDDSLLDDSFGVRQSIHQTDSSCVTPRLRSGKSYGQNSFTDYSDDPSYSSDSRPPIYKKNSAEKPTGDLLSSPAVIGILIFVVFVIMAFALYFFVYSTNPTQNSSEPDLYAQFKLQMATFKDKFKSQSQKSWKSLTIGTKHILNDPNPVYPAVYLMVGSTETLPTMNCISSGMISIINKMYNVTQINTELSNIPVSDLDQRSAPLEKLDLDKRLDDVFSTGYKGARLVNVEKLSPEAALMLHSYCDNDNAPFKNILLILELVSDEIDTLESNLNKSVEDYLRRLWEEELGTDKLMALLSRISNNAIRINPESPAVLNTACV